MKLIKNYLIKHKFVVYSATLLIVALVKLGLDSDNISDFFTNLWVVLLNSAFTTFALFLLSMFSMWLLYPILPKSEDFNDKQELENYFKIGSWDLWLFLLMIIIATLSYWGVY
ncbi:MAG: hypothetical protein V1668_04675 [Patescibacteria group bacterium]